VVDAKHRDAIVEAVGHVDAARIVGRETGRKLELPISTAAAADFQKEVPVRIEDLDAIIPRIGDDNLLSIAVDGSWAVEFAGG
jgi:hypothetical protein